MKGKCKGRERKGKVLYPENLENVPLELLLVAIRFLSAPSLRQPRVVKRSCGWEGGAERAYELAKKSKRKLIPRSGKTYKYITLAAHITQNLHMSDFNLQKGTYWPVGILFKLKKLRPLNPSNKTILPPSRLKSSIFRFCFMNMLSLIHI